MADVDEGLQLPLDLLRTFVAAVECGGFTAASRRVHRSQAAVSMQMRRLERDLGCELFVRRARGVAPTPDGERLLGYARRILKLHDQALAEMVSPEIHGTVRLGAPEDYAGGYLAGVLARFARAHPRVVVEMHCEPSPRLLQALEHGRLEMVLCTSSGEVAGGRIIHRESLAWAVGRGFETHRQRPLPLAVFHAGCPYRGHALQALERAGIESRVVFGSPSLAAVLAAVRAGLAVAPVARSLRAPGCRLLDAGEGLPELPGTVVSLHRADNWSIAATRLAAILEEQFARLRSGAATPPE